MNAKQIARVLIVVLAALALTALVAAAQDAPAASVTESEPNNSFATADFIDVYESDVMSGKINPANDQDYFHVIPDEEDSRFDWVIDIDTDSAASPLDTVICVFDHDRVEVACNDDSDGVDSLLFVTFSEWPTDFYIQVREYHYPNEGGDAYSYKLSVYQPRFVSAATNGTINGVAFQAADILVYNPTRDKWSLFFDASDKDITANTSSIEVDPGGAALVFAKNQVITDVNGNRYTATPYDVVQFTAEQWGENTYGYFEPALLLDGSTVGLTTSGEKIDALARWWPDGSLLISTTGGASVPATTGGALKGADEDLLEFHPASGKWSKDFDGSNVPGLAVEDVYAAYEDLFHYDIVILGSGRVAGIPLTQKDILMVEWGYGHVVKGMSFNYKLDAVSK